MLGVLPRSPLVGGVALFFLSLAAVGAQERPNIVLLLADDLGWTGLSCFGSDLYETPNLDRLASEGIKFTSAYAACTVCSPTRAALMTGQYPARLRLTDFIAGQHRPWAKLLVPDWQKGLLHRHTTLAEALSKEGYHTGMVGKWHLERPGHALDDTPIQHGFDVEYRRPPQTRGYHLPKDIETSTGKGYLTDYLTDKAVSFIQESSKSLTTPFFLYVAYHVPHTPIQGRPDLVEAFEKKVNPKAVHRNATYAAMVASLDQSVGRLLDVLEETNAAEDTLIIFTSDNGGLTQRYGKHDGFTENLPLRRGKGSAYEGGVRVPTIVRWPGVTTPGTPCPHPIISMDFFPTLLRAAGNTEALGVDGQDIRPWLASPNQSAPARELFWHYPHYHAGGDGPYSAILSGSHRLIEFHEDPISPELYDLANDPGEQENIAPSHPELAMELQRKLHVWRESIGAQMPTTNPKHDLSKADQVAKRRKRL